MKRFVIGDIHGGYYALIEVLKKSGFNYDQDLLICLGDVCDGWPQVKECINELLQIKNLIYVIGNHDWWTIRWFDSVMKASSSEYECWSRHGGKATRESYNNTIDSEHLKMLKNGNYYYELDNKIFVHGGFDEYTPIDQQNQIDLCWNRDMIEKAFNKCRYFIKEDSKFKLQIKDPEIKSICPVYDEIYVGHTPVQRYHSSLSIPQQWTNVWAMDTGACFDGPLSLMNIDTKEIFQSKDVWELYPDHPGRNLYSFNDDKKYR